MSVPYVIEKEGQNEKVYDLYSRLLKDRIIFISDKIDDRMANSVVAQLLFLEVENPELDITFYINSPGGEVTAGLAIYDTMQYIKPDVSTLCFGQASSMASTLLCSGAKGKRFILKSGTVMIHQPVGGFCGQVSDIVIRHDQIVSVQKRLYEIYCEVTGKPFEQIKEDCDRDKYMSAEEAVEYGLVDEILTGSKKDKITEK